MRVNWNAWGETGVQTYLRFFSTLQNRTHKKSRVRNNSMKRSVILKMCNQNSLQEIFILHVAWLKEFLEGKFKRKGNLNKNIVRPVSLYPAQPILPRKSLFWFVRQALLLISPLKNCIRDLQGFCLPWQLFLLMTARMWLAIAFNHSVFPNGRDLIG